MEKLFGTDGIRGKINHKITTTLANQIGNTLTKYCRNKKIVIATDTRTSGDLIKFACITGLLDGGVNVIDIGIATTPSVAYLTKYLNADFGIMISASHNPPEYNGIKIFDNQGLKLTSKFEQKLEKNITKQYHKNFSQLGKYEHNPQIVNMYTDYLISLGANFKKLKIVLDASNGAAYKIAPLIFKKLGAKVITINCNNDGKNINNNCGALHPNNIAKEVLNKNADVGFAFDGDADRIIAVDKKGEILDGDQIIYILATHYYNQKQLTNNMVIGTINSNISLKQNLNKIGIRYENADVGDKYVVEKMIKQNCNLGGEQCGHIILSNYTPTGDGVLTAVILANIILEHKINNEPLNKLELLPQQKLNITVKDKNKILTNAQFKKLVNKIKKQLDNTSRIVVRASGTEPKIRILIESNDIKQSKQYISKLKKLIKQIDI